MKRLQSKHRMFKTPNPWGYHELVYADRPKSLFELLSNTVAQYGAFESIVCAEHRLTYKQFGLWVENASSNLYHRYGIRKGDRVALMLRNGWEFATCFFALVKIGAITVPLNIAYKGEEAAFQINDSGSKMVIVDSEFYEVIADIRGEMSEVKDVCVAGSDEFRELVERREHPEVSIQVDEMDSAVIMYTSGTTGRPKGAVLSHRGIINEAMCVAETLGWQAERDKNLCPVPLFHVTGLVMNLCGSIYGGIPIVFMKRFNAVEAIKIIDGERITTIIGVPTILWLILNAPEFDQYDLKSLRCFAGGGAATPEELLNTLSMKLPGTEMCPGYGLTEACGMTATTISLDEALRYKGSVGRSIPLIEAKVIDSFRKEVPPGEPGELAVRGCTTFKGYWNNPEATQKAIVEGWVHTGDIATMDKDGYIYILDRMKDMINRGGEKIWSLEVENVLYRNPKVLEAAVVGVSDPIFGEEVKAVIVLRPGEQATPEEIQEFCSRHLAKFKIPKFVEFRTILPRNPAGKVIKDELKK